jgi:hypothetical protein
MNFIINRNYDNIQTPGRLLVMDGYELVFKCFTLELPWLNNQKRVSCILEGRYICNKHVSSTKGKSFIIENVPDRTNVMMHSGNFASGSHKDTEGCIMPGRYFEDLNDDGNLDVCESRITMDRLYDMMPDSFYLTITS